MAGKTRSQASMEFLMTYSFAFVLIAIFLLVAVLIATSGGPTAYLYSTCSMVPALPCLQSALSFNSAGAGSSAYAVLFRNEIGYVLEFPANALNLTTTGVGVSGKLNTLGGCSPQFASRGALVVCNAIISGSKSPNIGTIITTPLSIGYYLCASSNSLTCSSTLYTSTGYSTQSVSPPNTNLNSVKIVSVNGSVVIDGANYFDGSSIYLPTGKYTIYASPDKSYQFDYWQWSGGPQYLQSGTAQNTVFTAEGAGTLTAVMTLVPVSSTTTTSTSTTTTTILSSGVLYSVPITLTNPQGSATPAPFQQMITVDSASYSSYINSAWSNVEFTTGNAMAGSPGTTLQAWVESNAVNTATNTIVWVNLPNGIGADSSFTIYINFLSSNVMSASGPTGEAPQLSSTYAEYDNGASVFTDYQNFAGASMPSGWANSGGSASVSNGLTITGVSGGNAIVYESSQSPPSSYAEDVYGSISANVASGNYWLGVLGFQSAVDSPNTGYSIEYGVLNGAQVLAIEKYTVAYLTYTPVSWSLGANYITTGMFADGDIGALLDYQNSETSSDSSYSSGDYGIRTYNANAIVQWWRIRAYPPGGVMPSTAVPIVASASASPSSVYQGQSSALSSAVSGGTPPYTYQWYEEAPGASSYSAISGATSSSYTFPTSGSTTTGTWHFEVQVTDSEIPASQSTSTPASVTVTAPTYTYSLPITLTNSQSSATPAPFQQMITIDSASYSSYINSAWSNVEFTTGNAMAGTPNTILQAWVESNAVNTATNTIVWVNLPNGIGADSSTTIYMDTVSANIMSSAGPTGEAPQLSSTYAEYDNGASVFTMYQNFEGTSLPAGWVASGGSSAVVDNGITYSKGSSFGTLYTTTTYNAGVFDFEANQPVPTGSAADCRYESGVGDGASMTNNNNFNHAGWASCSYYDDYIHEAVSTPSGGSGNTPTPTNAYGGLALYSVIIPSQTSSIVTTQMNYAFNATVTTYIPTMPQGLAFGMDVNSASPLFIQYLRERAYPPNGVMPSVAVPIVASASASPSSVYQSQSSVLSSAVSGGTPPYTYQWYEEAPGASSYSAISGATSSSYTFPTSGSTTTGTWHFEVQVTDSEIPASQSTSTPASVTVTAPTYTYSLPITLTNSQSSATPAPFQQMITIDSASYSSYINSAWSNVEFTTGNAMAGTPNTILQAWVESNAVNTATNTIVWVNLPNGIGADSSTTIYMDTVSANIMSSAGPTGEAPQLSSTYAEYDNGASVFSAYFNMQNNPVSSSSLGTNHYSITTNTGPTGVSQPFLTWTGTTSQDYAFINLASTLPSNYILTTWVKTNAQSYDIGYGAGSTTAGEWDGYVADPGSYDNANFELWKTSGTSLTSIGALSYSQAASTWYTLEFQYISGGSMTGWVEPWQNTLDASSSSTKVTGSDATYTSFNTIELAPYSGSTSDTTYWALMVARAYPPNGIMPTVS